MGAAFSQKQKKTSPFSAVPTEVGASIIDFLLIQEACLVMRTSHDFERYVLTSFGREHTRGVVRWKHDCASQPSRRYPYPRMTNEHARRVELLLGVCAVCPRIKTLAYEQNFSRATCACKPKPCARELLVVTPPGRDPNKMGIVGMDVLRRAACYKHLTFIYLLLRFYDANPDTLRPREYFPSLQTLKLLSKDVVDLKKTHLFLPFLRRMGPIVERLEAVHLSVGVKCWREEFAEPLSGWKNLKSISIHAYVGMPWATSGDDYKALLDSPRFFPESIHRVRFVVEGQFCDKEFATFAGTLVKRLRYKFPKWRGARVSSDCCCGQAQEILISHRRELRDMVPKVKLLE